MDQPRSSGLLLHITSLPGAYGIGDLGPEAYRFADFLAEAQQEIWQVLPLVPTGLGNSPYSSPSTFAANPLLISIDLLIEQELLHADEAVELRQLPSDRVDFEHVIPGRLALLARAYDRFCQGTGGIDQHAYQHFVDVNADWLEDYALFMALKERFEQKAWTDWPEPFVRREENALMRFREENEERVGRHIFWQYLFHEQWIALKRYCNDRGIRIFGDLPIYVALDSADVWAHPELFHLDEHHQPTVVAGVPPDYFSETGQRWGNPLYRWDLMQENDFAWWKRRLEKILGRVDLVRLDHFRAFEGYWEIPATEETAINGRWVDGPGGRFFERMQEHLGPLPVVAEDLGIITDGVRELMRQFGFPGMAVLQFGFDSGPSSTFLPHNFKHDLVVYTGTHDNDTLLGWWTSHTSTMSDEQAEASRAYARRYLDLARDADFTWAAIRQLLASVARMAVIPVQDVIGLGSEARMNTPGVSDGNWTWRMQPSALTPEHARRLADMTTTFGRTPSTR